MKKMIQLLTVLIIAMASTAIAGEVTLAWDANNPAPDGYRLFVRETDQEYDYLAPAWEGTATQATISNLSEGVERAFVVRAYIGDNESGDSNEVVYTIEAQPEPVIIPQRVKGLRIIFE
jgi:hypothetical protein